MFGLLAIWGTAPGEFFAVGSRAQSGRTVGSTWMYTDNTLSLGNLSLNAVWGSSNANVLAVGGNGTAIHWDGSQWELRPTGTTYFLSAISGSNSNDVYVAGRLASAPVMLHYDGAMTWTDLTGTLPSALSILNGVWASGANVYAVGDAGKIIRKNGNMWETMPTNTSVNLSGVSGLDSDVFVVGAGGTVLRYRIP